MARGSLAALAGWVGAGALAGIAAGLYIGELTATQPVRVRRLVRRGREPVRTGFLARLARQELAREPLLHGLTLQVLPVSARTVELHGWVTTRAQRALAGRAVRRVAGLDTVINGILVRGEDDLHSTATPDSA